LGLQALEMGRPPQVPQKIISQRDDDHGMLRHGFMVYDALFAWLRHAAGERHNWPAKAA